MYSPSISKDMGGSLSTEEAIRNDSSKGLIRAPNRDINIGALIITYTIAGFLMKSIVGPKTLF